jgi:hypothetical protein
LGREIWPSLWIARTRIAAAAGRRRTGFFMPTLRLLEMAQL